MSEQKCPNCGDRDMGHNWTVCGMAKTIEYLESTLALRDRQLVEIKDKCKVLGDAWNKSLAETTGWMNQTEKLNRQLKAAREALEKIRWDRTENLKNKTTAAIQAEEALAAMEEK